MKAMEILRRQQVEDSLAPFSGLAGVAVPKGGWAEAVRTALGLSRVALARRLGRKAPQTVEDLLASEAAGTIKLNSLRALAEAMDCRLVYAIVPNRPLEEIRRRQALARAGRLLKPVSHSMLLEDQGLSPEQQRKATERLADTLLAGSARALWE